MGSWLGSNGLHLCQSQLHVGPVMDLESSLPPNLAEVARCLSGMESEEWEWLRKKDRGHGARKEGASQGTGEGAPRMEEKKPSGTSSSAFALLFLFRSPHQVPWSVEGTHTPTVTKLGEEGTGCESRVPAPL